MLVQPASILPKGSCAFLGGAAAAVIVFGIIGYAADLRRQRGSELRR
jgi:hypothetical protein